ncbi:hypothetical protein [Streptomyces sp. DSM 40484]|uniref:hypothetical protein n=1 Tax=Streptomyces kroppenstedtii TaxID=3051181 RepID=UPI0028D0CD0C|nr:hypothetical protein [Streptomyces sp. DSM 40484]
MALFTRTPVAAVPETWTPEGTIVVQRYRALEGATVLVYCADTGRSPEHYAAACLGCTYRTEPKSPPHAVMTEAEAAKAANAHAAACRALSRGVPARPDDSEAAELIRTRLWHHRYGTNPHPVHLATFTVLRVDLQRSTDWIKTLLASLAQADPGFIAATPTGSGEGVRFAVQPFGRP